VFLLCFFRRTFLLTFVTVIPEAAVMSGSLQVLLSVSEQLLTLQTPLQCLWLTASVNKLPKLEDSSNSLRDCSSLQQNLKTTGPINDCVLSIFLKMYS
jgi:hypothetical protein